MIRIETDERGFWLTIEDPDVFSVSEDQEHGAYTFLVTDPDELARAVNDVIMPWIQERELARADFYAGRGPNGEPPNYDADLDPLDPHHPDYAETLRGLADVRRKAEKEDRY